MKELQLQRQRAEKRNENIISCSCIHDQIIEQRNRPGRKVYYVSLQVYEEFGVSKPLQRRGRALSGISEFNDAKQPIRIYLNYDVVGHSSDRDCCNVGDIVKLGEAIGDSFCGHPCNPHGDPPVFGDCWYNSLRGYDVIRDAQRIHEDWANIGKRPKLGSNLPIINKRHTSTCSRSGARHVGVNTSKTSFHVGGGSHKATEDIENEPNEQGGKRGPNGQLCGRIVGDACGRMQWSESGWSSTK